MRAFAPGIYPRSEALVQATRDRDRGRTTAEAVDEQLAGLARQIDELLEAVAAEVGVCITGRPETHSSPPIGDSRRESPKRQKNPEANCLPQADH